MSSTPHYDNTTMAGEDAASRLLIDAARTGSVEYQAILGVTPVHRLRLAAVLAVAFTFHPSLVRAQEAESGAAEALFQSGKKLLEQKEYAQACPKLAESYRLDPGTGTLLALALCHEGEGKVATAWGEFADAAARSRREGRPDREDLARQHQSSLEPRLSMLTISVAPGGEKIDHLEIKRDGVVVGPGAWATAVPVDVGAHRVDAAAPGYKPFSTTVTIAADAARETTVVPVLERSTELPEQPAPSTTSFWSPLRYASVAVGVAGVAGVIVGTVFGVRAIGLNNDSKNDCDANSVCGPSGMKSRLDARSAGDVSTVAFVAGGVLLAGGATMFVLAKPRQRSDVGLIAAPLVSERQVGMGLEGTFW